MKIFDFVNVKILVLMCYIFPIIYYYTRFQRKFQYKEKKDFEKNFRNLSKKIVNNTNTTKWKEEESNLRSTGLQPVALPTELSFHISNDNTHSKLETSKKREIQC